jgi:hypothetical protein
MVCGDLVEKPPNGGFFIEWWTTSGMIREATRVFRFTSHLTVVAQLFYLELLAEPFNLNGTIATKTMYHVSSWRCSHWNFIDAADVSMATWHQWNRSSFLDVFKSSYRILNRTSYDVNDRLRRMIATADIQIDHITLVEDLTGVDQREWQVIIF